MQRALLTIAIVATGFAASLIPGNAQEASPPACSVSPRGDAEISGLVATPSAPGGESPMILPVGTPIAGDEIAALDLTLREVRACARAGDLGRLLALYSDEYVSTVALAPEPVVIVPGERQTTSQPAATPAPEAGVDPSVEEAVHLPDGRIAARVSKAGIPGTEEIVIFIVQDGRWVIDEIHPVNTGTVPVDLPEPVQAAIAFAAEDFGIDVSQVELIRFESAEWPDSSLGCPVDGEFYMQVITPGYRVIVQYAGDEREYHTNEGEIVRPCS